MSHNLQNAHKHDGIISVNKCNMFKACTSQPWWCPVLLDCYFPIKLLFKSAIKCTINMDYNPSFYHVASYQFTAQTMRCLRLQIVTMQNHICDQILENRPSCHKWDFESRNTDFKYWSRHGFLVLDYSHAGFTIIL